MKTDAKIWAQQTEAAMREGKFLKTAKAKKHALTKLIDRYVESILRNCSLADLFPVLIAQHRDLLAREETLKGKRRSPATIVRYMVSLSHALTIAINE